METFAELPDSPIICLTATMDGLLAITPKRVFFVDFEGIVTELTPGVN